MTGDHDRPLAPRGLNAAPRMGKEMRHRGLVPDLVLCSTASRARETLALVLEALDLEPETVFDRRVYEAAADELIGLVTEFCPRADRLLVVGHNCAMQIAASRLSQDGPEEALIRLETKYPTAALAIIDFDEADWRAADLSCGRLVDFITPHTIADG